MDNPRKRSRSLEEALSGLSANVEWREPAFLKAVSLLLGGCLAIAYLNLNFTGRKTDFEDAAALGAATTTIRASVAGYRIHCDDSRDAAECLAGVEARHAVHSVLWLGNSQVHAVNQLRAGETNATPLLFDQLKNHGLDLITFSQPNANLQEHYVLFEYLRQRLPLRFLILPVVFDDTREDGLRKGVADFLGDPPTALALSRTEIGQKILRAARTVPPSAESDTAGISHTLQERVEKSINAWLGAHSSLWASRPEMRGRVMLNLYLLRNALLGIRPTSKRKLIKGRYLDNLAALEAILTAAASQGIRVVMYVAPLRNDVDTPYVDSEYRHFKAEVQVLAQRHDASFANLENLVPAELWGSKAGTSVGRGQEMDFMHFQAGGHKLLAARLAELVSDAWVRREVRR
ncbi:hypothetical protein [Methylococcus capsulatus]|uniref:hypothetical protein n=1 Tax=Methylococcus capsulatus TaxID=414 RepID=UPI001C52D5FE|nr:hypothetical protein [Methylococcus capsulatus]QXP94880.1 hypothetical protein KW113_06875 [Methylococcus capsulatus]